MRYRKSPFRGITLIELLFTVGIAAAMLSLIISSMYWVTRTAVYTEQRTMAQRIAAIMIEEARQTAFANLGTRRGQTKTLDDKGTVDEKDDITATADLIVRRASDGTEIPSTGATGEDYLIVEAVVTWWVGGDIREDQEGNPINFKQVRLVSEFAP